MCEDSDRKLRSLLCEHVSRVKVKLERFDGRMNAESKIDTDEPLFEVTWFAQSDTESPALEFSAKDEPTAVDSTELDTKMVSPIAECGPSLGAEAIDEHSTGFNSLNAWLEPRENDFEMSANGATDKTQKQDVRTNNK